MFNEITEKVDQLMIKDKTRSTDIERESLFFIIAGSEELWNLQNQIYDFVVISLLLLSSPSC